MPGSRILPAQFRLRLCRLQPVPRVTTSFRNFADFSKRENPMHDKLPNSGPASRQATFRQFVRQIRDSHASAVDRGVNSPVVLAVDISNPGLQKLMLTVADKQQMRESVHRSRQKAMFPLVLFDVPAEHIRTALGRRSAGAADYLSAEPAAKSFRAAVLDDSGITWGKIGVRRGRCK